MKKEDIFILLLSIVFIFFGFTMGCKKYDKKYKHYGILEVVCGSDTSMYNYEYESTCPTTDIGFKNYSLDTNVKLLYVGCHAVQDEIMICDSNLSYKIIEQNIIEIDN